MPPSSLVMSALPSFSVPASLCLYPLSAFFLLNLLFLLIHSSQIFFLQFSGSVVSDSLRPHGLQVARLPCPSPTPELTQTHVHRVGDAIQASHPPSSTSPPAFSLFQHQGLSNESVLRIRWPKYWSFSISPSNE